MSNSPEPVSHQGKIFSNVHYVEKILRDREFIKCEFHGCDFTKSDLRENDFVDCVFLNCNFSMALLEGTGLGDVVFVGCKLLGVDFTRCNKFMFSFSFEDCHLDYSTFYGTKLRKTRFKKCVLKETDFTAADLTGAIFDQCDLQGTIFSNSNLEKTDFRTAKNFSIDLDANKVKDAKFSSENVVGLLDKYKLDIT
jgi:fluoroquinolone resistance protein